MLSRLLPILLVAGASIACALHAIVSGAPPPADPVSVEVRPSRVFVRTLCTLRVKTSTLGSGETVSWKAGAGRLLYDDLPEVHWRAPDRPGRVTLELALRRGGAVRGASAEVDVVLPSTDDMVWIPPGTSLRGDVEGTRDPLEIKTVECANDEPFHDVYLDGYWIDRNLVSNRRYVEFLESALSEGLVRVEDVGVYGDFEGEWVPYYYFRNYDLVLLDFYEVHNARKPEHLHRISYDGSAFRVEAGHEDDPVVDVTWYGSAAYARYHGKVLPSDAQWEKAARGGDGRRYPWGENLPTRYHASLDVRLRPVGSFSPVADSPHGVSDIFAGCFEWTNDWFNAEYYADFLGKQPFRNPRGPFWGQGHSIRGFPGFVRYEVDVAHKREPLCLRYQWFFEFILGDIYGDRVTGFRTVYEPTGRKP